MVTLVALLARERAHAEDVRSASLLVVIAVDRYAQGVVNCLELADRRIVDCETIE